MQSFFQNISQCDRENTYLYELPLSKYHLGEGNLISCCTDSPENFFRSLDQQNDKENAKFQGQYL